MSADPSMFQSTNGQMVNPQDIAMLAQQGYLRQQQQLTNMGQFGQAGAVGAAGAVRPMAGGQIPSVYQMGGITPQMQQDLLQRQIQAQQAAIAQQAQAQSHNQAQSGSSGPGRKKRGPKPSAGAQMISRQTTSLQPPHSQEQYIKNALSAPPSQAQISSHTTGAAPTKSEPIEPWADALDELDPREIAMGRFRKRHEVLGEIFGPDATKDIPQSAYDPWAGLGIDGETLEAKVLALEKENEELEARSRTVVEDFSRRLKEIESSHAVSV
ncbi:uncharacterized protein I303_108320 [Kwoniella dejecticola CBS 10117]|uniref:Uncharacterized protein n=1 Tax=Kwoniella dejecticola CBS 10117 TaxID=1296121 RepID=A0A1A5ZXQ1_9TREE|nr:uncharacterized protein I303_07353 [Kwoniella dejecticola CBS 10117]OBR82591.1 hypothetical protein I303_07353 [Kwoniella dejecticola CBS 10117]